MDRTTGKDGEPGPQRGRASQRDVLDALAQAEADLDRLHETEPGPEGSEAEQMAWASPAPHKRADGQLKGAPSYRRLRPLTAKQMDFARRVIEGSSLRQAYRDAYGSQASDESASVQAYRLGRNPRIRALIDQAWEQTQEALVEDHVAARRYVVRSLVELSKGTADNTRLRALELLGKASGAFTPAPAERDRTASPDALRRDLAQHLRLVAGKTVTDAG
jgi:hypothetical protein